MKQPLIIGHRGFAGRFPHNSVAAVKAALEVGADGVEVDIRPSADGVWMCHHDLACHGRKVCQWRYRDLAGFGVPPLAAVLEAVPEDRWLFVEVKPLARPALLPLLDSLAQHLESRSPRLLLLTSSLRNLALLRLALPKARCSWILTRAPKELPEAAELSPHHTLVGALQGLGRLLHPWTVNIPAQMEKLAELGVASITTDFPDRAVALMAS